MMHDALLTFHRASSLPFPSMAFSFGFSAFASYLLFVVVLVSWAESRKQKAHSRGHAIVAHRLLLASPRHVPCSPPGAPSPRRLSLPYLPPTLSRATRRNNLATTRPPIAPTHDPHTRLNSVSNVDGLYTTKDESVGKDPGLSTRQSSYLQLYCSVWSARTTTSGMG